MNKTETFAQLIARLAERGVYIGFMPMESLSDSPSIEITLKDLYYYTSTKISVKQLSSFTDGGLCGFVSMLYDTFKKKSDKSKTT